ncbi:hypothetical protein [Halobacillus andaensis]|uniref:hypothetical protein n=1 Tax=Halobacillus andaensis TaxID=1176239 RepID=UPI003D706E0A
MKKIASLFIAFFLFSSISVQALDWAPFVVWEGKVYNVTEEIIPEEEIGDVIGEVNTKPNERTGSYYGNASNVYPKGTKYSEIEGTSTDAEIAVEKSNSNWVKAEYAQDAPFHLMNLAVNPFVMMLLGVLLVILVIVSYRRFK